MYDIAGAPETLYRMERAVGEGGKQCTNGVKTPPRQGDEWPASRARGTGGRRGAERAAARSRAVLLSKSGYRSRIGCASTSARRPDKTVRVAPADHRTLAAIYVRRTVPGCLQVNKSGASMPEDEIHKSEGSADGIEGANRSPGD
jgi:hypothetical protein